MGSDIPSSISTIDAVAQIQEELAKGHSLPAIDLALESLDRAADDKTQRRALRLLCRAALNHCGVKVSELDHSLDAVFHPELPQSAKRLIGICLLRALEANPDLFVDITLRNRTFLLFDAVLPDLYKDSRIDVKRQTHEKEAALRSYIHDAEYELQEVFRPLEGMQVASWESIAHSRSVVLKLLRKYGSIFSPFLNKDLLGPAMEDQFSRVHEYIDSDEASALHTYERAKEGLTSYKQKAQEHRTKYSKMLCEALSIVLYSICERKFEQSGAGKAARLIAKPFDKKYPFQSTAHMVNVGFIVENVGPGYAREVSCSISTDGSAVAKRSELFLGNLGVDKIAVEFAVELSAPVLAMVIDLSWTWLNFDGTTGRESGLFEVFGQQGNVDWDQLAGEEPYKLEPVTSEQDLVGRKEILSQLTAKVRGGSVGSACIWGQKRVGKTSIAKTLKTMLSNERNSNVLVLFLEAGEYVHPEANRTIEQLGAKICRQVGSSYLAFRMLKGQNSRAH
jgi:uncharacterized protein